MEILQQILVYIFLGAAVFYLAWKFIIPGSYVSGNKKSSKDCGQDGCGCG